MTAERDDGGKDEFLSRWSRLKQQARQAQIEPPIEPLRAGEKAAEKTANPGGPAPELPPLDQLTIDSDYRDFFHPKVDEGTRRAALKKLFSDSHFNVMDGLDVYIDDYSKTEPIPAAMLAGLKQAQNILQWAREDTEERERAAALAEKSAPQVQEQVSVTSPEARSGAAAGPEVKAIEPAPASTPDAGATTPS